MKTLFVLSFVQIVLILYLVASERNVNSSHESQHESLINESALQLTGDTTYAKTSGFDEDSLRQIIREEFAKHMTRRDTANVTSQTLKDETENQYLSEEVELRIEQLKGIGQISQVEMMTLESDVMRLREVDRRRMMSKLVTALNAGEIKGHLN